MSIFDSFLSEQTAAEKKAEALSLGKLPVQDAFEILRVEGKKKRAEDIKKAGLTPIGESISNIKDSLTISPDKFFEPSTFTPDLSQEQIASNLANKQFLDLLIKGETKVGTDQQFKNDNKVIPDSTTQQPSPKEFPALAPVYSAVGNIASSLGGAALAISSPTEEDIYDKAGNFLKKRGDAVSSRFTDTTTKRELANLPFTQQLVTGEFWSTIVPELATYSLSLLPAWWAGSHLTLGAIEVTGVGALATRLGITTLARTIGLEKAAEFIGVNGVGGLGTYIASVVGGSTTATIMESTLEGGDVYNQVRQTQKKKGASDMIADFNAGKAFEETFINNMKVTGGFNFLQSALTFAPGGKLLPKGSVLRGLTKVGVDVATGREEEIQQFRISTEAQGGVFDRNSKEAQLAGNYGMIFEGVQGLGMLGMSNMSDFIGKNSSPEATKEYEKTKEKLIKKGIPEENAKFLAVELLAAQDPKAYKPGFDKYVELVSKIKDQPADSPAKVAFDEAQIQIAKEDGTTPQFAQDIANQIVQQDNLVTPSAFVQENRQLVEQAQQATTLKEFQQQNTIPQGIDAQSFFEQAKQKETVASLESAKAKEVRQFRQLKPEKFKTFKAFFEANKGKGGAIISSQTRAREEFKIAKQEQIAQISAPAITRLNDILNTQVSDLLAQNDITPETLSPLQDTAKQLGENISADNQAALNLLTDDGGLTQQEKAQVTQDEVKLLGQAIEDARRSELTTGVQIPNKILSFKEIQKLFKVEKEQVIQRLTSSVQATYDPSYLPGERMLDAESSDRINAVEQAVGEGQGGVYQLTFGSSQLDKLIREVLGLVDERTSTAIFDFRDSGKPLPPDIKELLGDIPDLITLEQKFIIKLYNDNPDIVTNLIDGETYVRRGLVGLDGEPASNEALTKLRQASSDSQKRDLFAVASGMGKLSTKSSAFKNRRFKTADEADDYLEQFGLKTNRDFFASRGEQIKNVTDVIYNSKFKKTLRGLAKEGAQGVTELFDPEVETKFEEGLITEAQEKIAEVYRKAQTKGEITVAEKDLILEHIRVRAKEARREIRMKNNKFKKAKATDMATPDGGTITLEEFEKSLSQLTTAIEKKASKILNKLTKARNKKVREIISERVQKRRERIEELQAKAALLRDGTAPGLKGTKFVTPPDVGIANQLQGIMMIPAYSESITNIFAQQKPSNIEDAVRAVKLWQASFDLFQLQSIIDDMVAAGVPVKDLGIIKLMEFFNSKEFIKSAPAAVQAGLNLGRISDIDITIVDTLTELSDDATIVKKFLNKVDKTLTGKNAEKILRNGIIKMGGNIGQRFANGVISFARALEELQWAILLPAAKLRAYMALIKSATPKLKSQGYSEIEIRHEIANKMNNVFRGQNWEMLMAKHPNLTKSAMRAGTFLVWGPDRLTSTARLTKSLFTGETKLLSAQILLRGLILAEFVKELLNYMFNGHSSWENERGNEFSVEIPGIRDQKGNALAVQVGADLLEPVKFFNDTPGFIRNKTGPLTKMLGEILFPTFGKTDWIKVVSTPIPIPFALQNVTSFFLDAGKEAFGFNKEDYGVVDNFLKTLAVSGLEFSGFPSAFRSGESNRATLVDVLRGSHALGEIFGGKAPKRGTSFGGL